MFMFVDSPLRAFEGCYIRFPGVVDHQFGWSKEQSQPGIKWGEREWEVR